jgi:hypothetical protein
VDLTVVPTELQIQTVALMVAKENIAVLTVLIIQTVS